MNNEQAIIKNYGILSSISWNSNNWANQATQDDLKKSKYDYVKDNAHMHEDLNFGHDVLPSEEDGYYIGYTPMFNRPPDTENSKNVNIVFFVSSDYRNSNRKTIIGFYGFPIFGEWFKRTAKHKLFRIYDDGNIKAFPENIIYFENPIVINNDNVHEKNLLPYGKKISQQGFNYLNSDNVYNLIVLALKLNPKNKKLKDFVGEFPLLVELTKQEFDLQDFIQVIGSTTADSLIEISELEKKMKKQSPEIKQRISSFIERGVIANKIKRLTGFKCLVCEALGQNPYSFQKPNGEYYIETHHVDPVSTLKTGVLSVSNLMTVCANHHRQLHYGNSILLEQKEKEFSFKIDKKTIRIDKINIS